MAGIRDLVVTLSLNSDSFEKGMSVIKEQIKNAEQDFALLGAGIDDFENSIDGSAAKLALMNTALDKQNEALQLYSERTRRSAAELAAAEEQYTKSAEDYKAFTELLVEAGYDLETLASNDAAVTSRFSEDERELAADLRGMSSAMKENAQEVLNRTKVLEKDEAAEKKAKIAVTELEQSVAKQAQKVQIIAAGWNDNAVAIDDFKRSISGVDVQMRKAELEFQLATVGMKDMSTSMVPLIDNSNRLQTEIGLQREKLAVQYDMLQKYNEQLKIATNEGDAAKVREATDAIGETNNAILQTKINLGNLNQKLVETNQQMVLVSNGWYTSADKIRGYNDAVKSLDNQMKMAELRYTFATTGLKGIRGAAKEAQAQYTKLNSAYTLTNRKLDEQQKKLTATKTQLVAAQKAGDPEKIREATQAVEEANLEIAQSEVALKELAVQMHDLPSSAEVVFRRVGQSISNFGEGVTRVGNYMAQIGNSVKRFTTEAYNGIATLVKSSVDYETVMVNIKKTVEATDAEYQQMSDTIKTLSETIGVTTSDLGSIMQIGAQLGVSTSALEGYTEVMAQVANTSDLTAEEAATSFAKFAVIMGMSEDEYSNLGSTVVDLGNSMNATESEIINMAVRLAAAGKQVGMTESDIIALSASLASVGLQSQMGGSAFSKAIKQIEVAVAGYLASVDDYVKQGTSVANAIKLTENALEDSEMADFARVAGMSMNDYAQLWQTSAIDGMMAFIKGLAQLDEEGVSAIVTLQDLGMNELRLSDTILRAQSASGMFETAISQANNAWAENTALTLKNDKIIKSTQGQINNLRNRYANLGVAIGDDFNPLLMELIQFASGASEQLGEVGHTISGAVTPMVESLIDWANRLLETMGNLDASTYQTIIRWAGWVLAGAPVVAVLGKIVAGIGSLIKGIGGAVKAVSGLVGVLGPLPAVIGGAAIAATAGIVAWTDYASGAKAARESLSGLNDTIDEFNRKDVHTLFSDRDGLGYFGLSTTDFSNFEQMGDKAEDVYASIIHTWSDGQKETDEIMADTIKNFTDWTQAGREMYGDDDGFLSGLDEQVTNFLRSKQNKNLSAEDQQLLQSYIDQYTNWLNEHGQFNVEGFDKIAVAVDADTDTPWANETNENAALALLQGYNASRLALMQSYYRQLAELSNDPNLSPEEKQDQTEAMLEQRNAAIQRLSEQYLGVLGPITDKLFGTGKGEQASEEVDALIEAVQRYYRIANGDASVEEDKLWDIDSAQQAVDEALQNLDVDNLEEYLQLYTQLLELTADNPELADEVEELLPDTFNPDKLRNELEPLEAIKLGLADVESTLTRIKNDMVKFSVSFDMDTAETQWSGFMKTAGNITVTSFVKAAEAANPETDVVVSEFVSPTGGGLKDYLWQQFEDEKLGGSSGSVTLDTDIHASGVTIGETNLSIEDFCAEKVRQVSEVLGISGIEPAEGFTWEDLWNAFKTGDTTIFVNSAKMGPPPNGYENWSDYLNQAVFGEDAIEVMVKLGKIIESSSDAEFDNIKDWIAAINASVLPSVIIPVEFEVKEGPEQNFPTKEEVNGSEPQKFDPYNSLFPMPTIDEINYENAMNDLNTATVNNSSAIGTLNATMGQLASYGIPFNVNVNINGTIETPEGVDVTPSYSVNWSDFSKGVGGEQRREQQSKGKWSE